MFRRMEVAMEIKKIRKRDGTIVPFSQEKITEAIFKAAQAVGGKDYREAESLAQAVIEHLNEKFPDKRMLTVEEVQDAVEDILIKTGHARTAKTYILYREKRSQIRSTTAFFVKVKDVVEGYVGKQDWRVRENSNAGYGVSGLQAHISGAMIAEYTLNYVYPKEVAEAHRNADIHIHDLSLGAFAGYCAGWSLRQLLQEGFNGIVGKVEAKAARHFNAALGQIVNFFGTLQNEWAGAQAFSSFDTYLAPLVKEDKLTYPQVKQAMQEFIFAINQTSRWGNQVPFTNITFDWVVPEDLRDEPAIVGGVPQAYTYAGCQEEMDFINKAFLEVMIGGDMHGRIFTFPIPTYNITKDLDWDHPNIPALFTMTAKYGTPYFQNFINSTLKPGDVRSMCCRLQLDVRELRNKTGGLFGSGEKTGSVGVVTINLPRLGFLATSKKDFFERLERLMVIAKESLEIKRKAVDKHMQEGLLPYSRRYLGSLVHHFSTIGLCGMNECCLNAFGKSIATKEGKLFASQVLDFMRKKLGDFQVETGNNYNLEATPAEGTAFRFALHDKRQFPNIKTAGKEVPYYTNSTQLPVDFTRDIFDALDHQDELQCKYTGGTVLHGFLGEKISDWRVARDLVKKIFSVYRLPYVTLTPTFSICPVHGYLDGEQFYCGKEHSKEELEKFGIEAEESYEKATNGKTHVKETMQIKETMQKKQEEVTA